MTNKNVKPLLRSDELVVQEHADEILIYDLRDDKALCLNSTSALIWKLCDGERSVDEICSKVEKDLSTRHSEDIVWLALDQLKKEKLLENEADRDLLPINGLSRRQVIKKIGLGSAIAIPVVMSMVAPLVHAAASTCSPFNPPGPTVGFGGACYCPHSGTANGSTCGTGVPVGTDPQVNSICKTGCTCTRTQANQITGMACSPGGGNPNAPTCAGVCG